MKKIIFLLVLIFAVSPVSFAKEASTDTILISGADENKPTLNHASIKVGDAEYRLWKGGGGKTFVEGDGTKAGDIVSLYSVSLSDYKEKTINSFKFIYNVKQNKDYQKFYFHEVSADTAITTAMTSDTVSWESTPFASVQSTVQGSAKWVLLEADFTEKANEALAEGRENLAVAVTTDADVTGAFAMANHATYTVSAEITSIENLNPYIEPVSKDFSAAKNKTVQVSFSAGDDDGDPVTVHYFVNGRETDAVTENNDGVYTASFTFYKKGRYVISAYAADEYGGKSQTVEINADIYDYRAAQYFTDAEGNDLSGAADITSVKSNVTIEKICEYDESLLLLIAVYDSENKMIASNIKEVELSAGENDFDIVIDIPEEAGNYTVKSFVWDNLSRGFSLSDTYELIR